MRELERELPWIDSPAGGWLRLQRRIADVTGDARAPVWFLPATSGVAVLTLAICSALWTSRFDTDAPLREQLAAIESFVEAGESAQTVELPTGRDDVRLYLAIAVESPAQEWQRNLP